MKQRMKVWSKPDKQTKANKHRKQKVITGSIKIKLEKALKLTGAVSAFTIILAFLFLINISKDVRAFRDSAFMASDYAWKARRSLLLIEDNLLKASQADAGAQKKYLAAANTASNELVGSVAVLGKLNVAAKEEMDRINDLTMEMAGIKTNMMAKASLNTEEGYRQMKGLLMNDFLQSSNACNAILEQISVKANQSADHFVFWSGIKSSVSLGILLFFFILTVFILIRTSKSIIKRITVPMEIIKNALTEVSEGNLDIELNYESDDEFGALAASIRNTIKELKQYIDNINLVLLKISEKDMKKGIEIEYRGSFYPLKLSVNHIVDFINEIMNKMREMSIQVTKKAESLKQSSDQLADDAGDQSGSVEELAAAIQEATEAVRTNADHANHVSRFFDESIQKINQGSDYMERLLISMEQISMQSCQVSEIVKMIDEISSQTDLLSLNASIEAARAGVQGRGFKVVAEEIRKLAKACADAAKKSTELINKTLAAVKAGSELTFKSADVFNHIVKDSEETRILVSEIDAACRKQSTALDEISLTVLHIAKIAESNSSAASDTAVSGEKLLEEARILDLMLSEYKLRQGRTV